MCFFKLMVPGSSMKNMAWSWPPLALSFGRPAHISHSGLVICDWNHTIPNEPWQMGVSNNRGTPKWMICNGKPYQDGWFGGKTPLFLETPRYNCTLSHSLSPHLQLHPEKSGHRPHTNITKLFLLRLLTWRIRVMLRQQEPIPCLDIPRTASKRPLMKVSPAWMLENSDLYQFLWRWKLYYQHSSSETP